LNEFVASDNYKLWIELVAKFTIHIFSVYFLLNLWSKLIASKQYLKSTFESYLDNYIFEITKQFIQSRLLCSKMMIENEEDTFEDKQGLSETFENLPQMLHSNYEKSGIYLKSLIEPILQLYQKLQF
jgi:hypothetical protein